MKNMTVMAIADDLDRRFARSVAPVSTRRVVPALTRMDQ